MESKNIKPRIIAALARNEEVGMTDINQLTDIMRQFAEHKRQQADSMSEWKPGKLITSEKIRRLHLEARDLIGYADEIEAWWGSRTV